MLRATTPTMLSTTCLVSTYVKSWGAVFPFPQAPSFRAELLTSSSEVYAADDVMLLDILAR